MDPWCHNVLYDGFRVVQFWKQRGILEEDLRDCWCHSRRKIETCKVVCICAHEECRCSFEHREMLIDVIVVCLNIMFIVFDVLQIELFIIC